jgi:hypothetical protein
MGLLVRRLSIALVAVCCAASCAGPRPASGAYAVAARGACGDAQLVRKELIAMREKKVTRPDAARVLAAAAHRIDERADTAGTGAWRLRDLAASLRIMQATIVQRGDEGIASADTRVTRAEVGCVSAAR